MMFYATIFIDYFKTYLKTKLTYRADFWMEIITDFLFQAMNLFFILVVFQHTQLLGGWSEAELLFIYGYFMIPYGIFACFFSLWGFTERYIVKGEMDRILTRPAHNLAQLILENLDPSALFGVLTGSVIMGYAWFQLDLAASWLDLPILLLLVVGSVLVYGGIYIALTAISFFTDAPTGILPLVYNIQSYGRYPINIYNKMIQALLTFIVPFAFVGFYPAAYFLDSANWGGIAFLTPVVGIIFFGGSLLFWNFGVKRYRGAGS
jgi:ABC-2 type transport system permease protein